MNVCIYITLRTASGCTPCHLILVTPKGPWHRLTATLHPNECSGSDKNACVIHIEHGLNARAYRPMAELVNPIPFPYEKGSSRPHTVKAFFCPFSQLSAPSLYVIDHMTCVLLQFVQYAFSAFLSIIGSKLCEKSFSRAARLGIRGYVGKYRGRFA